MTLESALILLAERAAKGPSKGKKKAPVKKAAVAKKPAAKKASAKKAKAG
jgi:DNA topoisomerase-1